MIKDSFIQDHSAAVAHSRRVMTSSKDMTWATPQAWFDYLDLEFDFTLDPCCTHKTAKCSKHFTPVENGLTQSWAEETVFMNPPYGREVGLWMKKAYEEARDNLAWSCASSAPAWTPNGGGVTRQGRRRFAFPKGGSYSREPTTAAPFPVAIVIFRPRL
jgi:phage N-6-adenine-methyltransferase